MFAEQQTQLQTYQDAYQRTQNTTEMPWQTEYRLFAQVTRALIESSKQDFKEKAKALNWNRRLWMTLQADCSKDENALPDEIRAGIISLAIWVDKYSRKVSQDQLDIVPLVEVNRAIMDGLVSSP